MADTLHVELGRRYRFAASHRLHSTKMSEEENSCVYGKCNNPYGHGHNYTLEVRFSGAVDPATGMIANLADLDAFVNQRIIEPSVFFVPGKFLISEKVRKKIYARSLAEGGQLPWNLTAH